MCGCVCVCATVYLCMYALTCVYCYGRVCNDNNDGDNGFLPQLGKVEVRQDGGSGDTEIREQLIKNHFTQRLNDMTLQVQLADSRAVSFHAEVSQWHSDFLWILGITSNWPYCFTGIRLPSTADITSGPAARQGGVAYRLEELSEHGQVKASQHWSPGGKKSRDRKQPTFHLSRSGTICV